MLPRRYGGVRRAARTGTKRSCTCPGFRASWAPVPHGPPSATASSSARAAEATATTSDSPAAAASPASAYRSFRAARPGPVVECAACRHHYGADVLDHPTTTRFSAMLRDAVHTVALAVLAAGGTLRPYVPGDRRRRRPLGRLRRLHRGPARAPSSRRSPRTPGASSGSPAGASLAIELHEALDPLAPHLAPDGPGGDPPPGGAHRAGRRAVHARRAGRPGDGGRGADDLRGRCDAAAGGGAYAVVNVPRTA